MWQPHVVQGGARRRHPGAEAHHRARRRSTRSRCRPSGGRRSSTASPASPRSDGGTAVGAFSGFPHDTFPIAAKTGTAQVDRRQQGAHRGVRRLRPGHRRPVRHLRAAGGGRLRRLGRRARRPPAVRRAARPRPAPPAPEGGRFEVLDIPGSRPPGTSATDGRPPPSRRRDRVAPGALGRLSRNPAAPWRHIDLVLVGCIVAVAALGCLMIFSATRGPRPVRLRHQLPRQAAAVHRRRRRRACSSSALIDYRRYRELVAGALRRRAARCS